MSDAKGQGENAAEEQPHIPESRYEVVPVAAKTNEADLYSFRAEIPPPPPPPAPTPTQALLQQNKNLLRALAVGGAVVAVTALIAWLALRKDEPPAYIDLGTSNIPAAGLQGRLVARWLGSAAYELHVDPIAPQQLSGFSAVVANPPHPLSVSLRLKDASGVVCRKEILFPYNPQPASGADHPDALQPQKTFAGDTVQNVASADGTIDEIVVDGPLDCAEKTYGRIAAWDFSSNFPVVADQDDWLKHEQSVAANERRRAAEIHARALIPKTQPLSAPIEGDDVVVSDNPSRGSVETRAGRVFYFGREGLREAEAGWQVFPVAIHFRCDTKSFCVLTRIGTSIVLQARLVH